ncbi:hypothetical protein NXC14_PC00226 (plasmid) [Rhizobium sp. NXC14]|nr:hypothetical protein NXC14_PC00226 [Rhizobium sp. NXC14]
MLAKKLVFPINSPSTVTRTITTRQYANADNKRMITLRCMSSGSLQLQDRDMHQDKKLKRLAGINFLAAL